MILPSVLVLWLCRCNINRVCTSGPCPSQQAENRGVSLELAEESS